MAPSKSGHATLWDNVAMIKQVHYAQGAMVKWHYAADSHFIKLSRHGHAKDNFKMALQ